MTTTKEEVSEVWKKFKEKDEQIAQLRKTVTKRHYDDIAQARSKRIPLVYTTGYSPVEVLYAMGVQPVLPENYVTICCARQMAEKFCETAESKGISRDVCSYARVALGMMWLEDGPYGALPKPDFIMANPYTCDPHAKWFEFEAKYFNVPVIGFEGPMRFTPQVEKHEVDWVIGELKKLFASMERITGNKFDYDRFKEVMRLSSQARELYWEIQEYRKNIPCPRGLREIVGDLFYIVCLLGTQEAVDYFTMVRDAMKERAKHKIGILPQEKLRLIWDNIVIWYRLQLIDYFSEKGAVFAIDTYPTTNWLGFHFDGNHFDLEKPFESLALNEIYKNAYLSLELQTNRLKKMVDEWHCDGAVFFSNRGCQILSRGVPEKERMFREKTGALSMSFEAEMADPRSLYEAQVKARIDSFLEMLEQKKSKQ